MNHSQTEYKSPTHNGWTNWDTWNAALWLNNDENMYNLASWAAENLDIDQFIEECSLVLTRKNDIGEWIYGDDITLSSVNWREIYDSFRE